MVRPARTPPAIASPPLNGPTTLATGPALALAQPTRSTSTAASANIAPNFPTTLYISLAPAAKPTSVTPT